MKPTINDVEIYDYCPPSTYNKRDELFDLDRNRISRSIIFIRELFTASHGNRSARKYLKSHVEINNEKVFHLGHYPYTIHPFSLFRHWWDVLVVVIVSTGLTLVPYQAAFDTTRSSFESWGFVKATLVAFCYCDIFINFLTGYFDKNEGFVELKFKKIAAHYAKSYLVSDLLASLPTDLIFINGFTQYIVAREITSLVFFFRIFSVAYYGNKLSRHYELRRSFYDFFSNLYWLLMTIHWLACIYWIVPIAAVSMTLPQRPSVESWINSMELLEETSNFDKYCHCLLRSVSTLMRSGFSAQAEPRTVEDQLVMTAFLLISIFIFGVLVTRVMQLFIGVHSSKLKYSAIIAHLHQYMDYHQLPRRTQERVSEYYQYTFQRRYFKHPEILCTLSTNIRQEHRMHSCRKLVENVIFLNSLPFSLLTKLVTMLRSEVYLLNDVVVEANQTSNCMYFIATGTVAVYNSVGREVCHLRDGTHFGEIGIIVPDAKNIASVVAIETSKLYRLDRSDFAKVVHPYPLLWEKIKQKAIDWHEHRTGRK